MNDDCEAGACLESTIHRTIRNPHSVLPEVGVLMMLALPIALATIGYSNAHHLMTAAMSETEPLARASLRAQSLSTQVNIDAFWP